MAGLGFGGGRVVFWCFGDGALVWGSPGVVTRSALAILAKVFPVCVMMSVRPSAVTEGRRDRSGSLSMILSISTRRLASTAAGDTERA